MRRRDRRRGAAYVIALVALVTGLTLALAALRLTTNASMAESRRQSSSTAAQIAEAGLDYGLWLTKWGSVSQRPYTATTSVGAATFTVTIADNSAALSGTDLITSAATVNGVTRTDLRVVKKEGDPSPFRYAFALNKTTTISRATRSDADAAMFVNGSVTFNNSSISMAGPISATGTITRQAGTLSGTLTSGVASFTWPTIDLSYYQAHATTYYSSSKTLYGLTFPYDGAIIYCNGTLTIKNTISGKGTCVASGYVVLDGATQQTGSVIACLSPSRVELKNSTSAVNGILYAHNSGSTATLVASCSTTLTGSVAADNLSLSYGPRFRWDSSVFTDSTYTLLQLPGFY